MYGGKSFFFINFVFKVDQYANFSIYFDGKSYEHNDTGVTPRENIADNSGIKAIS